MDEYTKTVLEDEKTLDNSRVASFMASEMYKDFFNALMTAIGNSMKNFEGACWRSALSDMRGAAYYAGKYDAFGEISQRLKKEYELAKWPIDNHDDDALREIGERVRKDVEKMFPQEEWHSRIEYNKMMRFERAMSELLESYAREGFRLGKEISKYGHVAGDFNPEDFAELCRDTFIPKDYIGYVTNSCKPLQNVEK